MPKLDGNRHAKFVVLARISVGVDSASKAVTKVLELVAAEMEEIEVIDAPGLTYNREQVDALALDEKRLV